MEKTIEKVSLEGPLLRVIKNLPSINTLKSLAENKTLTTTIIGGEEWELDVTNTEETDSPRTNNMREIRFTKILTDKDGNKEREGIFTDNDFELVLGVIVGNDSIRLDYPVSLAKLMPKSTPANSPS